MKTLTLLIAFTIILLSGYGQSVSVQEAKEVAKNHYYLYGNTDNYDKIIFTEQHIIKDGDNALYYVFNVSDNNGFVIISADNRAYPVIGYSFHGNYSITNQPPSFEWWLDNRKQEILYIKENNIPADIEISEKWNSLKTRGNKSEKNIKSVQPLLTTKWSGRCYYNGMCPPHEDALDILCGRTAVGCVAVSMGQIIKYWSQPESGVGSNSYYQSDFGIGWVSADFAEATYNYQNMPDSINSQNDDVALLLFHCGVSVDMYYTPEGSGANPADAVNALKNHFTFSSASLQNKNDYMDSQWKTTLKNLLDLSYPMIYGGQSASGGHGFNCDGYQDDYFHFNWGWGGIHDGYFALNSLTPAETHNYNEHQRAIFLFGNLPAGAQKIQGLTEVCQGETSVVYSVREIAKADSYIWTLPDGVTGSSTTNTITVDFTESAVSGNITVRGSNTEGDGVASILEIIVNPIPETPTLTLEGNTLISNAPEGNQWYNEDGEIVGAVNQEYSPTEDGEYYVIVTINGCISEMSNVIDYIYTDIALTEINNNLNIYPNPVSNELIIEIDGNINKIEFEILNALGQTMYKGYLFDRIVVNTDNFDSGIYFLKLKDGSTFEFKKIVKE